MISRNLLNQTLTLQSLTVSDDGMGSQIKTWTDLGSFRGRISPITSQESIVQNKETMTTTHRIFCDPMTIDPSNRIRWGSYYFEIVGIRNPSELYHHLEIDVKELQEI